MYEGDSTITPIPSTPAPTIVDIVCVQTPEEYPEEYLEVDVLEPSPSAEIAAAELELMKLCEVLTSFYEKRFDLHGEPIFSDPTLPQLTLDKLLMDVVGIAESREITKPFNRLTKAFQKKLMAYTREVDPDAMNALMLEVIGFVSHELAKAYITEMLREPLLEVEGELEDEYIQEIEYIKTKPEENNLIEAETPKQSLLSSMLSSSKSAVIDVASSPSLSVAVTIDSSVLLETEPEQELILPPEPNEVLGHEEHEEFIVERSKLVIMPHSPNMVCCASLKAWASWIKEIIENAKMWCIWINQTIRDMRRMAAMLKGNVYDDNGQVVTLSRNDWNQFVVKLDRDIVAWRHYNQHVQEITDAILSHYNDKRVACCALCLEEDLHLSELGADHICEQLHEALQTTLYWRRWLHSMVSEAEALTTLMDEADIATLIEVTSSTELLAIAGATIITNRPTTTSSSTSSSSTYSIRAIGSRPPPSPRRPSQ